MERRQLVEETGGELKRFPQLTFQAFVWLSDCTSEVRQNSLNFHFTKSGASTSLQSLTIATVKHESFLTKTCRHCDATLTSKMRKNWMSLLADGDGDRAGHILRSKNGTCNFKVEAFTTYCFVALKRYIG
jgi:hypothetical protein